MPSTSSHAEQTSILPALDTAQHQEHLVIESNQSPSYGWRELWRYRELLFFFAWRDLKIRYTQSLLGVSWAILNPLLSTAIYSLFLGKVVKIPSEGVPYPIFSFSSILIWNLFATSLSRSTNSIVNNAHIIGKVFFPRLLIPLASVVVCLADYFLACTTLLILFPLYGILPDWTCFFTMMAITLGVAIQGLGLSLWLAPLNVRFRDISQILPFLIQLGMFATPVLYPLSQIPQGWKWLVWWNPMVGYVEGFRSAFFATPFPETLFGYSMLVSASVVIVGVMIFKHFESRFTDIL
jgi:lipopolysaccharide transport system permease protein